MRYCLKNVLLRSLHHVAKSSGHILVSESSAGTHRGVTTNISVVTGLLSTLTRASGKVTEDLLRSDLLDALESALCAGDENCVLDTMRFVAICSSACCSKDVRIFLARLDRRHRRRRRAVSIPHRLRPPLPPITRNSRSSNTFVRAIFKPSSLPSNRATPTSTTPITSDRRCSTGCRPLARARWWSICVDAAPMSIADNGRRRRCIMPRVSDVRRSFASCSSTARTSICATKADERRSTRRESLGNPRHSPIRARVDGHKIERDAGSASRQSRRHRAAIDRHPTLTLDLLSTLSEHDDIDDQT